LFATRADGLQVAASGQGIACTLGLRTYIGRAYQYHCASGMGPLVANGPLTNPFESGANAVLIPQPDQCCLLPIDG
jgi:putative spermidine/putrescine transport system ATP-binding protein